MVEFFPSIYNSLRLSIFTVRTSQHRLSMPSPTRACVTSQVFSALICLLLVVNRLVAAEYTLQILPSDKTLSKASNHKFVLTCKGQGGDSALFSQLRWYTPKDEEILNDSQNHEISRNYRVSSLDNNLFLHFENPKSDLSGTYTCRGLLQNSEALKSEININIYEDVTWDQCPKIQYLIKGNVNERINCKATANPKPRVIWTKGTEQLYNNPRYLINSSGIVIKEPVTDKDGGIFQITALVTETAATHEQRITVQIYSRPQILPSLDVVEGIQDDQIEMKCESSGVPQPLFSWFDHNRRNLSTVGGYAVDRNTGSLIISRLKKNIDEGNFTCLAENYAGKSERSTMLMVNIRPIIRSFINGSYEQGKESYIECRAAGEPLPNLSIRKDGMSRPFQIGDPRIKLETKLERDEKILVLTYLLTNRKDDGLHYCRAENAAGISEKTGHLEVKYNPDLSLTPLRKVKTWDNRPVNISCIADAIPNATIKWYKNGYEILPSDIYRISDSGSGKSLLFISPTKLSYETQVFGTYRCEGMNSLGKGYIDIDLERATAPGHIAHAQAMEITPTLVRFKIISDLYDGGMPIKKIFVECFNQYDPADQRVKEFPYSSAENIYIIDKLRPFTHYSFRFRAENEVGKGEYGQEVRIQTKAETRPDKPEFHNLPYDSIHKDEIISPYPHKFTATWNLPADNGRKIQYFEIKYYPIKKTEFSFIPLSAPKIERVSLLHDEMTTRTLPKLKANTYYRLELVAYNELGASEPAAIVFRTPQSSALTDDDMDDLSDLNVSSVPVGLIAGGVIICIIFILLLMDIFFYLRYKVGAIYFLRTHICNMGHEDENKLNNLSPSLTPTDPISSRSQLRYANRQMHRTTEPKQTIEVDNPAFDYHAKPNNLEEQSPMLSHRERERYSGFRSDDHDSAV